MAINTPKKKKGYYTFTTVKPWLNFIRGALCILKYVNVLVRWEGFYKQLNFLSYAFSHHLWEVMENLLVIIADFKLSTAILQHFEEEK